jgi:MSHA biogenesis protein MshJ
MNKITAMWEQWSDKFSALTTREKGMLGFIVIFLLCFGVYKIAVEPSLLQLATVERSKKTIVKGYADTSNQVNQIQNALNTDPNEKIKNEIIILKKQLVDVESELEKVMTDYVAPEKMTAELTRLLKTSKDVRIVGMSVLPTQAIDTDTELDLPVYYRHQFEVTVVGEYFALMNFVEKITTKNKQFGIESLNYKVIEHPEATMTLTLITISDNENVIKL